MIFSIHCVDRTDAAGVRAGTRPAHVDYLKSLGATLVLAGPFLADDGVPTGSFLLVEAADKAAAEAIAADDPYAKAGLFASVTISGFRIAFLNPPAA